MIEVGNKVRVAMSAKSPPVRVLVCDVVSVSPDAIVIRHGRTSVRMSPDTLTQSNGGGWRILQGEEDADAAAANIRRAEAMAAVEALSRAFEEDETDDTDRSLLSRIADLEDDVRALTSEVATLRAFVGGDNR